MASKTVQPAKTLQGIVSVPGDKSISHRAVIIGALSDRMCVVDNFLDGEDCLRTIEAFRQMGIKIERDGTQLQIHGKGVDGLSAPKNVIDCGNSGTTTRLLMGVLTGQPFEVRLMGDASLSRRPMNRVMDPLSQMGAFFLDVKDSPAHLPLRMMGTRSVRSIAWKSPIASAQVKSAILFAGLYASGATTFEEPSLSRDHTERMLAASGVSLERHGSHVTIHGGGSIHASSFHVPSDLSSAAFLLAAGLLKAKTELRVRQIGTNPTRTGFIDIVKLMGGACHYEESTTWSGEPVSDIVVKASVLRPTAIGGEVIPRAIDEIPILAVLATQAEGQTIISDATELRVKESDRLNALRLELSKMGAHIEEKPDGLIIDGPTPLHGAIVQSHGDHRLAMSLAIAALVADSPTTIEDVDCVATSFPNFWELLQQIQK